MKTKNRFISDLTRFSTGVATLMVALTMALVITGCGKKKTGGPAVVPAPLPPGGSAICPTCGPPGTTGQFIKSGLGFNLDAGGQPRFELALEFFGQPAPGGSGGVTAHGTFKVHKTDNLNPCIPPGVYQVRPYQGQAGHMTNNNDSFSIALEAVGPMTVFLELPNNYFLDESPPIMSTVDSKTFPFSMWNPMRVLPQGGPACGGSASFFLEGAP